MDRTIRIGSRRGDNTIAQVQRIISQKTDISEAYDRALNSAASYGYIDIVKYLISKGADPTYRNNHGKNVMSYAIELNDKNLIEYLKEII